MKISPFKIRPVPAIIAMSGLIAAVTLIAGPVAGINRTILLKQDSTITGREGIVASVDIAPGTAEGRHTHPADVYGYVLEGSPTMQRDGSPTVTFHAGEAFYIPAGIVHQGLNNSAAPAKIVVVFLAEKGKPLTVPVTVPTP